MSHAPIPQLKDDTAMRIRPFAARDERQVLDLTLSVFEPFYEESFRPLMGEVIFSVQHGNWREDYASMVPDLHKPADHKYLDVAEADGSLVGFVGWSVDPLREHGAISILAVAPGFRGAHVGRELCEHAMRGMKALGARIVEIGTGGDPFHAPARALYESLGCTQIPVAVYFREL